MKFKRIVSVIAIALMFVPNLNTNVYAKSKASEITDKYSDTNGIHEDRKSTEVTDGADKTVTDSYMQTYVSPSDIQKTSDIPDGYDSVTSSGSADGAIGVYIKRDAPRRVLDGTVLRCINNKCTEDLYTPKIKELPWLKSKIVKDLNFSAVYEGEWNSDNVMSNTGPKDATKMLNGKEVVQTRANKILGGDALVVDETYSQGDGYKGWTLQSNGLMNLRDAITVSYKALSDNYYWIQAYPKSIGDNNIPIEKTPFAQAVGAENVEIDNSRYYTDVWVSRTCPRTYFNQAVRDGVTPYKYDDTEACNNHITIGDFCVIVAKLLDLNGEDVIIDKEVQQLLSVYQRSIPAYLPSVQREAVKYLMARGVVDGSEKFQDKITADTALTILMRAKDKSSRLTFKNVQLTYDKSLLSQGFTGVELQQEQSPATSIVVESKKSVAEYYDYFIRKTDSTTFTDVNGADVIAMYVSDGVNGQGDNRIPGSDYIGEVNGYYHFKIPIIAQSTSAFGSDMFPDGCNPAFTITTCNEDNKPEKYYVESGGGIYDNLVSVKDADGDDYTYAKRRPFTSSSDELLVDQERKSESQLAMGDSDEIKLTSNTYNARIQIRNLDNTKWAGTYIKDITTDSNSPQDLGGASVYRTDANFLMVSFKDEKDPWGTISHNLTSDTMGGDESDECYPAYILSSESKPILMLSYSWLRGRDNIPNRITDAPQKLDGDGKYEIECEGGYIQVDTKLKTFAVGSVYTELGSNDKSPLLFKADNGDWYIDYRVIAGSSAGYILFDNDDGTKSFTPTGVADGSENPPKMSDIKSLTGSDACTLSVGALFTDGKLMLEGPYSKSNFMLYKLNRQGMSGDYLLVFYPKGSKTDDKNRDKIKDKLAKDFKITLGDDVECNIYDLDDTVRNADTSVVHKLKTSIENKPGFGYVYKVPAISSFNVKTYANPTDDSSCPLPIVSYNDSYYDINTNAVQGFSLGVVPHDLLTTELSSVVGDCDLSYDGGFSSSGSRIQFSSSTPMTPAPIGLTASYKDTYAKTAKEVYALSEDNTYKAVGTCGGKLDEKITSASKYSFNINDGKYKYDIDTDSKFYLSGGNSSLGKNSTRGIYILQDMKGVNITSVSDLDESELNLTKGLKKNIFDWKMFTLMAILRNVEDITTICFIVLLELVPRLCVMDFLVLFVLSMVSRSSLMKFLCDRVFDPYKILSFGMLDVNTVNTRRLFFTCFWACVYLLLLEAQTFTDIIAWIVQLIVEFASR